MPTVQARPRSLSACRKGALNPYPASASTHPNRTPALRSRSTSSIAMAVLLRNTRWWSGTRARTIRFRSFVQLSGRNSRFAWGDLLGHRLHALAPARADQTRHVKRAHSSPLGVAEPIKKGLEPDLELCRPVAARHGQGRLPKPTSHESRKIDTGNPKNAHRRKFLPK